MNSDWKETTPGWLLLYEESFLHSLALTLPANANCINIGAGAGTSSCALVRAGAAVASIDIDAKMFYAERDSMERQHLPLPKLFQILKPSHDVAKDFVGESADLVFVDGLHSFDGVAKDLELYTPKIKPGGILVCHDYGDKRQKEVTRAIKAWIKNNPDWIKIGQVLYMIAFRKPGGDESWKNGRL